jgi:hypothetical protein
MVRPLPDAHVRVTSTVTGRRPPRTLTWRDGATPAGGTGAAWGHLGPRVGGWGCGAKSGVAGQPVSAAASVRFPPGAAINSPPGARGAPVRRLGLRSHVPGGVTAPPNATRAALLDGHGPALVRIARPDRRRPPRGRRPAPRAPDATDRLRREGHGPRPAVRRSAGHPRGTRPSGQGQLSTFLNAPRPCQTKAVQSQSGSSQTTV